MQQVDMAQHLSHVAARSCHRSRDVYHQKRTVTMSSAHLTHLLLSLSDLGQDIFLLAVTFHI